ncbi:hypothetical protein [Hymenobacter metallilatus]|uniref:Uncharacterized protein n=1 Tax=Hymenobacter metallilatus TaxID=2493666 RepID=A0A428JU04_9BACT|nr:hypothetical protein [Hymenobacter metallilatus]RSK37605.1 hypothetical protein EI290_02875 [Hymenobacter metallilatus]
MTLLTFDTLPGRQLHHAGQTYPFCSGTGYLGMAHNPALHTSEDMERVAALCVQFAEYEHQ